MPLSQFPSSLDTWVSPTAASPLNNPSHANQHIKVNEALAALETKVGVDGSNVPASLEYRVATLELGGGITQVFGEVPSGVIDEVNMTFTLAHTPLAGTLRVYLNGMRLAEGSDYTLAGSTITFTSPPSLGSTLLADYSR